MATTRLAEIIAQAAKADGTLDRARLLDSLGLHGNDPTTLLIEATLEVELSLARARAQDGKFARELETIFAQGSTQLQGALLKHAEAMGQGSALLASTAAAVKADREATLETLAKEKRTLDERAAELVGLAYQIKARADAQRHVWAYCIAAFLAGAVVALGFAFTRLAVH